MECQAVPVPTCLPLTLEGDSTVLSSASENLAEWGRTWCPVLIRGLYHSHRPLACPSPVHWPNKIPTLKAAETSGPRLTGPLLKVSSVLLDLFYVRALFYVCLPPSPTALTSFRWATQIPVVCLRSFWDPGGV